MIIIGKILYLTFSELTSAGITEITIRQGIRRKASHWQAIKNPSDRRQLLVSYEAMSLKYKELVQTHLGGCPYEHHAKALQGNKAAFLSRLIYTLSLSAANFSVFKSVVNNNGATAYTDRQITDLCRVCAIFDFLSKVKKRDLAETPFGTKGDLMASLISWLSENKIYGLKVSNKRVLQRKLAAYKKDGYVSLISGKIGNTKACKLTDDMKLWLRKERRSHRRHTYVQIHTNFLAFAASQKWKVENIGVGTVMNYLKRPEVKMLCDVDRLTKGEFSNAYDVIVKRQRPTHPHDMWVMDGTPIELYYFDGKHLRRIYCFAVVDAHSWAIIGWSFQPTETKESVFEAMKCAYRNTGVLPLQLQFDHSSGIWNNAMKVWYEETPIKYITPAEVGNAKAKVIEPLFNVFHLQIVKPNFDNFSGMGIKTKKTDNQAHIDWIKKNKKSLPKSYEAVVKQAKKSIDMWNERALSLNKDAKKSPNERLKATENRAMELNFDQQVSLFWLWRMSGNNKKAYEYGTSGLKFQIRGTHYEYRVYDNDGNSDMNFWKNHAGHKFYVKYDFEDMDMVAIYDTKERFVTMAEKVKLAPMAIADHKDGDMAWLQKEIKQRKDLKKQLQEELSNDDALFAELGLKTLVDAENIAKTPITTVVKDNLNAAETMIKSRQILGLYTA
ncbi:MAG: DDE-type integrase/transposase/recombinase, partial [Chitinophagales bacterium]